MTDQQEQRTSKFKDVLNALVEMQHSPAYAVRREVLSRAELLIADLERSNIALSSALADAERRVWEEAAKTVERERYLGLPNIDATTRTVTVSYVHQWMQNKLTRIAATIRAQATPETPPVSGDGGEGLT